MALSTAERIRQFQRIHGNKYDYSLVPETVRSFTKIPIKCKIHDVFWQTVDSHRTGHGCSMCYGNNKKNVTDFIEKANEVHDFKYDYSQFNFTNTDSKSIIICKQHGEFQKTPYHHIRRKQGCPECTNISLSDRFRKSNEQFVIDAQRIHGAKYDYSEFQYTGKDKKGIVICKQHGKFSQKATHHIAGVGCPNCKKSKGELQIQSFLIENDIVFIPQKTFQECKYRNLLPFDFFLPEHNICLEYDGQQHFEAVGFFGGEEEFQKRLKKDAIKNEYCKNAGINLVRITYEHDILTHLLNLKLCKKKKY